MKLEEIMVKEVIQAASDETIAVAAQLMRERKVGCLVITADGAVKGIITDRDLLACLAEQHDPYRCVISAHMHRPVFVLRPQEEHRTAAAVMGSRRIKRLPIAKDGKLLGIVSLSDLAAIAGEEATKLDSSLNFFSAVVRAQAAQSGPAPSAVAATDSPVAWAESEFDSADLINLLDTGEPG